MKYLIGIALALLITIVLRFIEAILDLGINDFLVGWLSCIGWFFGIEFYEEYKRQSNEN